MIILLLKTFIRPYYLHAPEALIFLMGIFPNLAGSFLLPVGITMFEKGMFIFFDAKMIIVYCVTCFAALVANEYLQLIPFFGRTFDYFDILASMAGILIGYYVTTTFFLHSRQESHGVQYS